MPDHEAIETVDAEPMLSVNTRLAGLPARLPVHLAAERIADAERYAAPRRRSGGESSARLLHRWQRGLGLGERSRAKVDARGLGGDRDLLAGSRVSALAFLLRRLDPDGQLDKTDHTDLLRVAQLFEHDLLQRPEDSFGLGPRNLGAISDGDRELCLG
jgi:hypothetical protein